jgi:thymidine phosphorylase
VLRGGGPADTRALTVRLGAEMLVLGGVARDRAAGAARIEAAMASGAGWERLVRAVALQGGDVRVLERPERLAQARRRYEVRAAANGYVGRLDARAVGLAATWLGAGRLRQEDAVDPGVGITLHAKTGDGVRRGEPLCTLWYNDRARLDRALGPLQDAYTITRARPRSPSLVRGIVQ